jgi:hypothetical protein
METDNDLYYLQDKRSYVGNDILWWGKNGCGYTTDLRNAKVYTKEDALKQHMSRETDIPWPKAYIDARTRPAVDMQYIKRDDALEGTGIEIVKPEKPKKERLVCANCKCFMSLNQFWSGECKRCGADSRP